jgi:hypothetical protein
VAQGSCPTGSQVPAEDTQSPSFVVLAADGPGTGARLGVQESCSVVLLSLRSSCRVAGAAHGSPGAVVELVLAPIGAIGGDGGRVSTGLAGTYRVERRLGNTAREGRESFAVFAAQASVVGRTNAMDAGADRLVEAPHRLGQHGQCGWLRVGDADPLMATAVGGCQGRRRKGERNQ